MSNESVIGALWRKTGKNGKVYLSGQITVDGKRVQVMIFTNTRKNNSTHPDYNVVLQMPKEEYLQKKQETKQPDF